MNGHRFDNAKLFMCNDHLSQFMRGIVIFISQYFTADHFIRSTEHQACE